METTNGLEQLLKRIVDYAQKELQQLYSSSYALEANINTFVSKNPSAFQPLETFIRDLHNKKCESAPWGFFYGCEILPNIKDDNTYITFPLIHSFLNIAATAIDDDSDYAYLLMNFALRSILSYPLGKSIVYMMDANISGQFNRLSPISTRVSDIDSEKNYFHYVTLPDEKNEVIKELENVVDTNIRDYASLFPNLYDYNEQNKQMSIPYRFVFIKDIGNTLNENQITKLLQLLYKQNATKAGVYIFFSYKKESLKPQLMNSANVLNQLIQQSQVLKEPIKSHPFSNFSLDQKFQNNEIDTAVDFVSKQKAPISIMTFKEQINRKLDANTLWQTPYNGKPNNLYIPVGFENATKIKEINFPFDRPSPHAFIGGKSGSGKSILLHNLILNGALRYPPEKLRYYLVDMKSGVSFVSYKKLPHVAALSVSSNRHFGVSVLDIFEKEINQRGALFRKKGVTSLDDYNNAVKNGKGETIPYLFAIIDEYQALFEQNDSIAQKATSLIRSIHKQGRAFGVFLALCTQSLGGVDTDISQVGVKLSLVTNPNDSTKLIGNDAAARLKGIGRAILNTSDQGDIKSNEEFQVAFVDEKKDLPDYVMKINEIYLNQVNGIDSLDHLIFDDNDLSAKLIDNPDIRDVSEGNPYIYLGIPSFCRKEHVKINFHRDSQSNVLIIGNDRATALRLIGIISLQFLKIYSKNGGKVFISDLQKQTESTYGKLSFLAKSRNVFYSETLDLETTIKELYTELLNRENNSAVLLQAPEILYNIVDIRPNPIFNKKQDIWSGNTSELVPIQMLSALIQKGPDVGIHVLIYSYNTINFDNILGDIRRDMEVKIGLRGGNPVKMLYGFGTGEVVSSNGKGFILMPEDMGLTYGEVDNPGDPFLVYNLTGHPQLEATQWGVLFNNLPNK